METEKYLGSWELVPELCIYQQGDPPLEGTYHIGSKNGAIEFRIAWKDQAGQEHNLEFGGPLDGEAHKSDAPGVSHVKYEKISESILDSTSYDNGSILMYARRIASADASLLSVMQRIMIGESAHSNFQVYRRLNP